MLKDNYRYCTLEVSQLRLNFSNPIYLSQVNLNSSYLYLYFAERQNWAHLQNLWTKSYDVWVVSKSSQSNSQSFSQKCDPGFHDIIQFWLKVHHASQLLSKQKNKLNDYDIMKLVLFLAPSFSSSNWEGGKCGYVRGRPNLSLFWWRIFLCLV